MQVSGGIDYLDTGITITAGGMTITAGGLTVSAGAVTLTPDTTITGTLTQTGIATFAAASVFSLGFGTTTGDCTFAGGTGSDVSLAAGMNLLVGGTTSPTSGEGVLTLYEASEIGTSAGASGNQVNLFGVSVAGEGATATVLGYTSSVAAKTILEANISDTMTALIPINYNGTPLWIVCSTASA